MNRLHTGTILLLTVMLGLAAPMGFAETAPKAAEATRDSRLDWWRGARFGLFIHWGLFGFLEKEWDVVKIPTAEYPELAKKFNPVKFDAEQWVRTAKEAGIQYIVFTSKQHDGFCLFDSKFTNFDVVDATPFKRDVMQELAQSCHKQGMPIGWYHSILDWHHPDQSEFLQKETCCGERFPEYVQNQLWPQCEELLQNYGPIAVMWFDGEWIKEWTEEQGKALYHHLREIQPNLIINNRVGRGRQEKAGQHETREFVGDFGTPEQEIPATGIPNYDWETCMTMNDSWNYSRNDTSWKSSEALIRTLVDIASKGGNLLLDVGPTPEGEFPAAAVERLQAIGDWLKSNGESIYGTQASIFPKLDWGRCTTKNGKVYLHVFNWPGDTKLIVPALQNKIQRAYLLADKNHANLNIIEGKPAFIVELPQTPTDTIDSVVVLEMDGQPTIATDKPIRPENPVLIKLPFSYPCGMENTPLMYKGQPLLVNNRRPLNAKVKDFYLFIEDLRTGQEITRFGEGFSFVSGFVNGDEMNVFATENTDDDWTHDIYRFSSTDLQNWKKELVIQRKPGEHLFNTSVCRDDQGYLMAYDSNEPVMWSFRFARSKDLSHWEDVPGLEFTDLEGKMAHGNATMRYFAPYYYAIYGIWSYQGGPWVHYEYQLPETKYVTVVARSKDLVTWELSPTRSPMLEPEPGEMINNTDADLFEYQGRTYIYYATGNQYDIGTIRVAMYNGPMKEMLEAYFPEGVPAVIQFNTKEKRYIYPTQRLAPRVSGLIHCPSNRKHETQEI